MITVENISKRFDGIEAVKSISFGVKEGETLVLLGTSGCGKTTTLRMMNRLIEPDTGTIKIKDVNILTQSAELLRRNIGYVLQNHGLFPHYSVAENIALVPNLLHWPKEKTEKRIKELMQKLHLPNETLTVYPSELSGGQQQRVGLARALAADPPILLMDEPFGALDPITRASIRNEFKELDELKRKTIVMVTHDVQEAFELGNRICLMDKGTIQQIGTPVELLFHPANEFVQHFLDQQRLQLELKAVQLKDVWEYLSITNNNTDVLLDSRQSLWDVIDVLTTSNQTIVVKDEEQNEIKEVNFMSIQSALNNIKQGFIPQQP
ncbi:MAG: ATP-binding cassette domain-containing protein [Flavisolibacter sp.]|nr:ATP-binding cassette domain-containing protein [Flavisolibacter sp.]